MNVFVLCTGRCGSTTFIKACQHITNYSASHESRTGLIGEARFAYGKNHIEADNRLAWLLGRLDEVYGVEGFYVHLQRNERDTAASFTKRHGRGIMRAYGRGGILMSLPKDADPEALALDYCRTVTANIKAFLKDKPRQMSIHLETATDDFPEFCNRLSATVDLAAALAEFKVRYNASDLQSGVEVAGT